MLFDLSVSQLFSLSEMEVELKCLSLEPAIRQFQSLVLGYEDALESPVHFLRLPLVY